MPGHMQYTLRRNLRVLPKYALSYLNGTVDVWLRYDGARRMVHILLNILFNLHAHAKPQGFITG